MINSNTSFKRSTTDHWFLLSSVVLPSLVPRHCPILLYYPFIVRYHMHLISTVFPLPYIYSHSITLYLQSFRQPLPEKEADATGCLSCSISAGCYNSKATIQLVSFCPFAKELSPIFLKFRWNDYVQVEITTGVRAKEQTPKARIDPSRHQLQPVSKYSIALPPREDQE